MKRRHSSGLDGQLVILVRRPLNPRSHPTRPTCHDRIRFISQQSLQSHRHEANARYLLAWTRIPTVNDTKEQTKKTHTHTMALTSLYPVAGEAESASTTVEYVLCCLREKRKHRRVLADFRRSAVLCWSTASQIPGLTRKMSQ